EQRCIVIDEHIVIDVVSGQRAGRLIAGDSLCFGLFLDPVLARIEDMQAGTAAHSAGRHREMRVGDAERGAAARALGDAIVHALADQSLSRVLAASVIDSDPHWVGLSAPCGGFVKWPEAISDALFR